MSWLDNLLNGTLYGYGSPEGSATAVAGRFYANLSESPPHIWVKTTGTGLSPGNTGWQQFSVGLNRPAIDASTLHAWALNEASGSTFVDGGTGLADLTLAGSDIRYQQAGVFDDAIQLVNVATETLASGATGIANRPSSDISISCGIILEASALGQIMHRAYRADLTWTAPFTAIGLWVDASNRLNGSVTVGGTQFSIIANLAMVCHTPYYIALTYDSATGAVKMYINGNIVATDTRAGGIAYGTEGPWTLGGVNSAAADNRFIGVMSDARVDATLRAPSYYRDVWKRYT
jgi:hypothetical protein